VILTPNELVFTFGGSYICANFGDNRSRNATARVPTDGHTDRFKPIFTALHAMQTRSSDENSVRLSVRLSVTRVYCDKTVERSVQIYIPYERTFIPVF